MIERPRFLERIRDSLEANPIVALLGPRQCGKTTLARLLADNKQGDYFDLENHVDLSRLEAPMLALEKTEGLVVIDEIQRKPELFETLRVLADRSDSRTRFLLLGSASPHLVKGVSESLAGRVGFVDLTGLHLGEVEANKEMDTLWVRGGFPRSYLAGSDSRSIEWRDDFIRTFLERDIPLLGITTGAETLRRFWTMVAHYHGQVWNAAEFARSLGCAEATARHYLDILSGSYVVRVLQPWYENLKKRQVKSPRIYIRDSGILHALLGLQSKEDLVRHPKLGASWEGFALEQVIAASESRDAYFWSTHSGAEIDMLLFRKGKRLGFEVKYTDAPKTTKSMRIAIKDLKIDDFYIIYPGQKSYLIDKAITALSIMDLFSQFGRRRSADDPAPQDPA